MAQNFVSRKIIQYLGTLEKIIKTNSHPGINYKTLKIYLQKTEVLKKYIDEKIKTVSSGKSRAV